VDAPSVNVWLPAAAALAGAAVAQISPVIVAMLNARAETRRDLLRQAVAVAIEDHKQLIEHAQRHARATGQSVEVPPLSAIVGYHVEILKYYQRKGRIDLDAFMESRSKFKEIHEAIVKSTDSGDS